MMEQLAVETPLDFLSSYRCSKCGVTVDIAIHAHRVACWRCYRRMREVKIKDVVNLDDANKDIVNKTGASKDRLDKVVKNGAKKNDAGKTGKAKTPRRRALS